jgi:hypothetical protein
MTYSLEHHGVKGMHWGIRKEDIHPRYSSSQQANDRATYGTGAVRRINKRMHEGKSHKEALKTEYHIFLTKAGVAAGAVVLGHVLATHGDSLAVSIGKRAETNRGRAAMAATMGLGPAESNQLFKKNRKGVYNITTLK